MISELLCKVLVAKIIPAHSICNKLSIMTLKVVEGPLTPLDWEIAVSLWISRPSKGSIRSCPSIEQCELSLSLTYSFGVWAQYNAVLQLDSLLLSC